MQLIVIPARLGSSRLYGKPLLKINGKPMIQMVCEKAEQTGLPYIVATDAVEILNEVASFGGTAVITPSDLRCGTDRVAYAVNLYDPYEQYTEIINLQGDMPFVDPINVMDVLKPLVRYNMSTVVYEMHEEEQKNPNSVKAIVTWDGNLGTCRWFLRAPLFYGYHHAGIYGFKRKTLMNISNLPTSNGETIERLEQLRAIENNIIIGCYLTKPVEMEINTPEDLEKANKNKF